MKTTLIHLNEQATEVLEAMLAPGYISELVEHIEAIEDFIFEQWSDKKTIKRDTALDILHTLHSLGRDITTFLSSIDPHEEADNQKQIKP